MFCFSFIVRHTAAVQHLSSSPNDMKLSEDEFIIDESDRSFASPPWVTIPRKGRDPRQHLLSLENTVTPKDKKSREKLPSVSARTLRSDTQSLMASPIEKSPPSVEKILGTSCTDELENDYRSTEYIMHSKNAKKPSVRQMQRRVLKPKIVEEELTMRQGKKEKRNMPNIGQDKLQVNSKRNMEDHVEAKNEPIPKKQMAPVGKEKRQGTQKVKEKFRNKCFSGGSENKFVPEEVVLSIRRSNRISQQPPEWWLVKPEEGSVDRRSSEKNESSVEYHSRKKQAKKNQLSKNTGTKPFPSKRQKTERISRIQKSLNVKRSRGSVSSQGEISDSQSEPLENKADSTQKKSLNISGPIGGPKYQNNITTSQNAHVKSYTEECTSKTPVESSLDAGKPTNAMWEESGPSRFKDYVMSQSKISDMDGEKDQESLDLRIKNANVPPYRNMHHKLVLPSNSPNVRRTKRIRLKPLEYWRGERIDYQERPSGGIVMKILSPTPVSPIRKAQRNLDKVNKKANRKEIHRDKHEKDRLVVNLDIPLGDPFQATFAKDPETREIVPMDLIRPRDTYQFFVEQHGLKVFKTLDTNVFSTGKLVLGPHEEKGKQHVGQDILVFYVNFGDLLCTLHETPYMITTGDSFYVPSGNHYNIKNLLNVESCLLFTQIKR
ncbi:centromere protein C [Sigmodon hispidus]